MKTYGLIGKNLSHSFSKNYFSGKFSESNVQNEFEYENFELPKIEELPDLIVSEPNLLGLNVTIPFKNEVLKYIDLLDDVATEIRAVNTIKIYRSDDEKNYRLKGFNTDVVGFSMSLQPLLQRHHRGAMILGTGGAAAAVAYVLKLLNITTIFISRSPAKGHYSYEHVNAHLIAQFPIIINTTPVGTYPDVDSAPELPYQHLGTKNLLFDLTYNPEQTQFMKLGSERGATVKNGLEMLQIQAEEAWKIWNNPDI